MFVGGDFKAPVVPAAWHPDPHNPDRERWWDGSGWTDNVRSMTMLPPIANPNLIGSDSQEIAPTTASFAFEPLPDVELPPRVEEVASHSFAQAPHSFDSPITAASPFATTQSTFPPVAAHTASVETVQPWAGSVDEVTLAEPTGYVPMSRMATAPHIEYAELSAPLASTFTPAIWVFGLLSLVHLVIVYAVLFVFDTVDFNSATRSLLALGPLVLYPFIARWDARTLASRGHRAAPFSILSLVPPIYLLARAFRAPASSLVILLLWSVIEAGALALLLSTASITIAGFTIGGNSAPSASVTPVDQSDQSAMFEAPFTAEKRAYILTPAGMAKKLMYDYGSGGVLINDLVCKPLASTEPTSQTTCAGTLLGTPMVVTVIVGSDTDDSVSPVFVSG